MSGAFTGVADHALGRMIGDTPLCWIVPHAAPEAALLMPVVLESDAAAQVLLGHLPRGAPATAVFAEAPAASFLFLGPNGYVSPAMAGRSDWAPTWNFVSARLTGTVALDEGATEAAVEAIVAQMEGDAGWRIGKLGPRAAPLLARVIGFRAVITEAAPRFKLGQDEDAATFAAIADSLAGTDLGAWMREGAS